MRQRRPFRTALMLYELSEPFGRDVRTIVRRGVHLVFDHLDGGQRHHGITREAVGQLAMVDRTDGQRIQPKLKPAPVQLPAKRPGGKRAGKAASLGSTVIRIVFTPGLVISCAVEKLVALPVTNSSSEAFIWGSAPDRLGRLAGGRRTCPGEPAVRRGSVIKAGRYFIKGIPLNKTDFRSDPAHPRRSARVRELLGTSGRLRVVLRNPTSDPLPAGVVLGEAASPADVHRWARRVDAGTVAAGGADFFAALLRQRGHRPQRSARRSVPRVAGTTLFISGSLAESSLNFLAGCAARDWPVLMMSYELFAGLGPAHAHCAVWARRVIEALGQQPRVAIGIGQPTLPGRREGARLGRWLTETVRQVLAAVRPDRVCVEGGSTSARLLRRLGWKRLNIECEFRRGVTAVRPPVRNGALLVFKPGSYDWPAVLTQ